MPLELVLVVALVALVALLVGFAVAELRHRRLPHGVAMTNRAAGGAGDAGDAGADLAELIDTGVLRLDAEMRIVEVNVAAERLLGRGEVRVLVGRSLMEAFVDHRVEDAARVAAAQGSAAIEVSMPDGDERRIAVRIRRAAARHLWLLLEDVTELRRLQRIRSEFIDNLSHELRTPLTTIRLLTETLRQDMERTEVPSKIRERINKIDVETGHLVQMVNELLDLSRIEGGVAELHFESVDMSAVVAAGLERLRTFAERQGVQLATQDVPGDGAAPRVWADEERLGQVLVNLLHNAVKFSPGGSTVTVATRVLDRHLAVEVRDEGVGIPRAEIDRVFERFYKVDKARQRGQGGTGLGLAIARHIIEGHRGRIWVESDEGSGATFTFTVPLAAASG